MANWDNMTVKDTLSKIKNNEIVLPVIQRRLVWNESKMELLFDSLLRGNSFGAIICIEEEKGKKPLFAFREFSKDGKDVDSMEVSVLSKNQWFVIDGQQRLQSLFIGLNGSINGKRLYFDLLSDFEEEYDFKFSKDINSLPKKSGERKDGDIESCYWFSASDLFEFLTDTNDDDELSEELTSELKDDEQIKRVKKNIRTFYKEIFMQNNIGISNVKINKKKSEVDNKQRIVELFRRLNDGGTKLSAYDLVASMFKGFDYNMEKLLDKVVSENKDITIDQDNFIKLLLILNDKPNKEITDLTVEDVNFATENFERIELSIVALKKFLTITSNIQWFNPSKKRSAIPLYFLIYHIFYSQKETKEIEFMFDRAETNNVDAHEMAEWLKYSLLNAVFARGRGWIPYKTGVRKIHAVMKENKGHQFPKTEIFNVYCNHPLYFYTQINNNNLEYLDHSYVYYLIYNKQKSIRNEDVDHIHPRVILNRKEIPDDQINSIKNYQLIESGTNRGSKNGKEFGYWVSNEIEEINKKDYLKRHLIPKNETLWYSEKFEEFKEERGKMIIEKINESTY